MEKVYGFLPNKSKRAVVSQKKYEADREEIKDCVIEIGEKNGWKYRKWKSGYCEMAFKGLKTFSPNNKLGSIYCSEDIKIPFPFNLPVTYSGSVECGDPPCWANMHGLQMTECTVRVLRGEPYTNIKNYLTIYITGKWK